MPLIFLKPGQFRFFEGPLVFGALADAIHMETKIDQSDFSQRCKPLYTDEIMQYGIESITILGIIEPIYVE